MAGAKAICVAPIKASDANSVIRRLHYSGKIVNNSQLHLGVFLDGYLLGAMQFGPPMDKRKVIGLVKNTGWNGLLELNRMAFDEILPRNSESRAISVALKLIKKHYPHIEWIISFADGTQCGDGAIYRASGFLLTGIKRNNQIVMLADGRLSARVTVTKGHHICATGGAALPPGTKALPGFQFRYMYFLIPDALSRLTVPVIPFAKIEESGARMYRGQQLRPKQAMLPDQGSSGGAAPTRALQFQN